MERIRLVNTHIVAKESKAKHKIATSNSSSMNYGNGSILQLIDLFAQTKCEYDDIGLCARGTVRRQVCAFSHFNVDRFKLIHGSTLHWKHSE